MQRRHLATLNAIFRHPASGTIPWKEIEALFRSLGAELSERKGSRIGVRLFGVRQVFHRPHPSPNADKGVVRGIRKWLRQNGVTP